MQQPTLGSLFAGIGGFDVGFENAGYRSAWQVELNPVNRAVLADRFPHARQFEDVRQCGAHDLCPVDVLTAGFPCQDISVAGARESNRDSRGLRGERSGLFWEVIRILKETQPRWVVLENVVNLLAVNDSQDFETVMAVAFNLDQSPANGRPICSSWDGTYRYQRSTLQELEKHMRNILLLTVNFRQKKARLSRN